MKADRGESGTRPTPDESEEARRTFAAWAAGTLLPPTNATPADIQTWRATTWDRLRVLVEVDPDAWLTAAIGAVRTTPDEVVLALRSWLPFEVVLVVGGESIQRRAADSARKDPRLAAVIFWALRFQTALPGQPWSQDAAVVSLLGVDTAVAAAIRLLTGVVAEPGEMSRWNTIDFWAFHLGGRLGTLAPELGWEYVRGLVAGVPDEVVPFVGTGELADFCAEAGSQYIEAIEAEASRDPRFRAALGAIWPGGERIPPAINARIQRAAGLPG